MAKRISRRGFVLGGAALLGASCLPDVEGSWSESASSVCDWTEPKALAGDLTTAGRVVERHDESLLNNLQVNAAAVDGAMQQVLLALTGTATMAEAWAALIPTYEPGQIIGIKVNTLNDRVPTSPALVKALVDAIKAGLSADPQTIVVWDRRMDELSDAGFSADALGCTLEATLDTPKSKGSGRGYELGTTCIGGQQTHLTQMLTRRVDHLINFAVMKNHKASGVTGCLKNNYGVIDNPGDFHDLKSGLVVVEKRFDPAIPNINALPEVATKTRLWLMDSLIGVCKGDTSDAADCFPARLLASLDPVAIDARGKQIRDEQRGDLGPHPETISEDWLNTAERYGLGSKTLKMEDI